MAYKPIPEGTEEFNFFKEYFIFRKTYYIPEDNDKWYEKLIEAGNILFQRYSNTEFKEFAKDLIVAHMEDINRRAGNE